MTEYCFACGGDHPYTECPSIAPPKPPAPPGVNPPTEERPSSSLAPTQYEELFGEGMEGLLQDVLDRRRFFSKDEQNLASAILSGSSSIRSEDEDERAMLDSIARKLAYLEPPVVQEPEPVRPAYVHTREEMETF